MQGPMTSHAPPFTLPIRYMLTGLAGFITFAVLVALQSFKIASGLAFLPAVVALTHTLTLMVLLSFVTGAVYQLLTVAFLTPLKAVRLARLNYWLYAVGVIGLLISMGNWYVDGMLWFGSLLTLSIYIYAGIVVCSLRPSKVTGPMRGFVFGAHVYLALAVTMAILLLTSMHVSSMAAWFNPLLYTHIVFAVSFFTFLIFGFTYKLFPMFTLAHGFGTKRHLYTLCCMHAGVWLLVAGIWSGFDWLSGLGAVCIVAGVVLEVLDILEMYRKRMRKKIDIPIHVTRLAVVLFGAGVIATILMIFTHADLPVWQNMVTFYLLGWIALTVISYAYKIIPFLIWSQRYGKRAGKEKVPVMADLLNLKHSRIVYALYGVGIVVFLISMVLSLRIGIISGCFLLAAALVIFVLQMVHVLEPSKLWREMR